MSESEDLRVVEARTAMNTEWRKGVYDGYHGPAHVRHAAWLRLLERIDAYADARAAAAAAVPDEREPEQQSEQEPESGVEVTSATEDNTSTIGVSTQSPPARAARRTTTRKVNR